jgi:hypothetical protein
MAPFGCANHVSEINYVAWTIPDWVWLIIWILFALTIIAWTTTTFMDPGRVKKPNDIEFLELL